MQSNTMKPAGEPSRPPQIWTRRRRCVKPLLSRAIRNYGHFPTKAKVLDAGCGGGEFLSFFHREGFEVYAMDLSLSAGRRAAHLVRRRGSASDRWRNNSAFRPIASMWSGRPRFWNTCST
jgi:2-polyprenyl-3-methyl-5-hydroxy-6-metoxy-1,4-benzoquinol methylase